MKNDVELLIPPEGIAGVDEAGRGPLAGSVVVAAVILDPEQPIDGLTDSKKLTERRRAALFDLIIEKSECYSIAEVDCLNIDQMNILKATLWGMEQAIAGLSATPTEVWVDGNQAPSCPYPLKTVVKGDLRVQAISAASILAKVTRDRMMIAADLAYPEYGFARHKGYGTQQHRDAIAKWGPCPIHRKTFAPVSHYFSEKA